MQSGSVKDVLELVLALNSNEQIRKMNSILHTGQQQRVIEAESEQGVLLLIPIFQNLTVIMCSCLIYCLPAAILANVPFLSLMRI